MNKYYKNFILCGDIDLYCLLCKENFQSIPDIEKHIRWEKHRKNLKGLTFLPKFKKDSIYKIENKYYCEICNLVTPNMSSVTEHIKCDAHKLLKSNPDAIIKKPAGLYTSGYVVINKVILNKSQWNSIVDKKCLICDVKVKNVDEHAAKDDHIIKLIQSETHYADNQYYRKINEETFHCFACKKVFSPINLANHWLNCENNDEIEIKKLKESKSNQKIRALTDDMSKMAVIEKKLVKTLQEFYDIDETTNVAVCKVCNNYISIDFKSLIEHMRNEHNAKGDILNPVTVDCNSSSSSSEDEEVVYTEVSDCGHKRALLAAYGKLHSIKLNHNASKGYCTVCDRYLSAHMNIFKEHVKGILHRGHLELLGLKKSKICEFSIQYSFETLQSYITTLEYAPRSYSVWINDEVNVSLKSFLFIHPILKNPHYLKTKCLACNELFEQGQEYEHCLSEKHKKNFFAAANKVIANFNGELIREVRPNLYHCSYCNVTLPYPSTLHRHMRLFTHLERKMHHILYKNSDDSDDGSINIEIPSLNIDEAFYRILTIFLKHEKY